MSSASRSPATSPELEWIADLTLEHEGRVAAVLRSQAGGDCSLEIAGRRGLRALSSLRLENLFPQATFDGWQPLAALLPSQINLNVSGVRIGHFQPAAPPNFWAKRAGLPFGILTVDAVALLRVSMMRER